MKNAETPITRYEIVTRCDNGDWTSDGIGTENLFDSVEEAEDGIEQLRKLGEEWANAEYRVRIAPDPRLLRAYRLAQTAGQWLKCRDKQGRPFAFGIGSATHRGMYHMVTLTTCTCRGYEFSGECYHRLAVRLHVDRCKAEKAKKGTAA